MDTDTNINKQDVEISAEQDELVGLQGDIELNASKLLTLIMNLNMPEEAKESLIELLPLFSLEQLERLTNILEAKYLDEKTSEIDEQFRKDMDIVVSEFENKDQKDREDFLNQINVISQGL